VEQGEEHFLHALVSLRMVEQGVAPDIRTAVEQLENWWEEDEELRLANGRLNPVERVG
jgi:hypothetical protein